MGIESYLTIDSVKPGMSVCMCRLAFFSILVAIAEYLSFMQVNVLYGHEVLLLAYSNHYGL
jgi:hypothetical protein